MMVFINNKTTCFGLSNSHHQGFFFTNFLLQEIIYSVLERVSMLRSHHLRALSNSVW